MYRWLLIHASPIEGFPHRRGGVPIDQEATEEDLKFSPQAWGCTALGIDDAAAPGRFPHRRGGVPPLALMMPPRQGVFPTGVGVYRPRLSHDDGGGRFPTGVGVYRV